MMRAPPKPEYPIATTETLKEYDGYLFGIPTRYGSMPAQLKVRACHSNSGSFAHTG